MQHEFDHLDGMLYVDRLDDGDWKTVQKIARKRGWGRPGASWTPGRRRHRSLTPGNEERPRSGVLSRSLPGLDSNQEPIG